MEYLSGQTSLAELFWSHLSELTSLGSPPRLISSNSPLGTRLLYPTSLSSPIWQTFWSLPLWTNFLGQASRAYITGLTSLVNLFGLTSLDCRPWANLSGTTPWAYLSGFTSLGSTLLLTLLGSPLWHLFVTTSLAHFSGKLLWAHPPGLLLWRPLQTPSERQFGNKAQAVYRWCRFCLYAYKYISSILCIPMFGRGRGNKMSNALHEVALNRQSEREHRKYA